MQIENEAREMIKKGNVDGFSFLIMAVNWYREYKCEDQANKLLEFGLEQTKYFKESDEIVEKLQELKNK